jgi:hypothetical protein
MKPTTEHQASIKALLKPKVRAIKSQLRAEMNARINAAVKELRDQLREQLAQTAETAQTKAEGNEEIKPDASAPAPSGTVELLLFIKHFDNQLRGRVCTQYTPNVLAAIQEAAKEDDRCLAFLLEVLDLTHKEQHVHAMDVMSNLDEYEGVRKLAGALVKSGEVGVWEGLSLNKLYSGELRGRLWVYGTDG